MSLGRQNGQTRKIAKYGNDRLWGRNSEKMLSVGIIDPR